MMAHLGNWRACTRSGLTLSESIKLEKCVNRLILLDVTNFPVLKSKITDPLSFKGTHLLWFDDIQYAVRNAIFMQSIEAIKINTFRVYNNYFVDRYGLQCIEVLNS